MTPPPILFPDRKRWPNFVTDTGKFDMKFYCAMSGECRMDADFMDLLQKLRVEFDKPLMVSSGYRSPAYNKQVSDTGDGGPHTTGHAVDLLIQGADALHLVAMAVTLGFTGVGVSQKGVARFVHLDNLTQPDFPRPTLWSY